MRQITLMSCVVFFACSSQAPEAATPVAQPAAKPAAEAKPIVPPTPKAEPAAAKAAGEPGVSFANVRDGSTIKNGLELAFVVRGKTVNPAGDAVDDTSKGHHHLIIDGKAIDATKPVPADATHIHFGKGQVSHVLNVAPGQHTLTLQFADGAHRSYGPDWSKTITVTVVPGDAP